MSYVPVHLALSTAFLHRVGCHDDGMDLAVPHHAPEVDQAHVLRPHRGNVFLRVAVIPLQAQDYYISGR